MKGAKRREMFAVVGALLMGGLARGISVPLGKGWMTRSREEERMVQLTGAGGWRSKNSKRDGAGKTRRRRGGSGLAKTELPTVNWNAATLARVGLRKVRKALDGGRRVTMLDEMIPGAWAAIEGLTAEQLRAIRLGSGRLIPREVMMREVAA